MTNVCRVDCFHRWTDVFSESSILWDCQKFQIRTLETLNWKVTSPCLISWENHGCFHLEKPTTLRSQKQTGLHCHGINERMNDKLRMKITLAIFWPYWRHFICIAYCISSCKWKDSSPIMCKGRVLIPSSLECWGRKRLEVLNLCCA